MKGRSTAWTATLVFMMTQFAVVSALGAEEGSIKTGVARPGSHLEAVEISIPPEYGAIEVELKIQNPESLDLDLQVWDVNPAKFADLNMAEMDDQKLKMLADRGIFDAKPKCRSDGIGDTEYCRLQRPPGGTVWAVIEVGGGEKATLYQLDWNFLRGPAAEPLWIGKEVFLREKAREFRLAVEGGALAIVRLDTADRNLVVQPIGGQPMPVYGLGSFRYVAIGKPFEQSKVMLSGLEQPREFSISVSPGSEVGPYGLGEARLAVIGSRTNGEFVRFLIPFSEDRIEREVIGSKSRRGRIDGRLSENGVVVYPVAVDQPVRVRIESGEADFDLALCDQQGQVLEVQTDELLLEPKWPNDSWSPAQQEERFERSPRFLVVFPSAPGSQQGGAFRLMVMPDMPMKKSRY